MLIDKEATAARKDGATVYYAPVVAKGRRYERHAALSDAVTASDDRHIAAAIAKRARRAAREQSR